MSTSSDWSDDPAAELSALCRALGAHVEQLEASGVWGVPRFEGRPSGVRAEPKPVEGTSPARPPDTREQSAPSSSRAVAPAGPGGMGLTGAIGARLQLVQNEVRACQRCGLHAQRRQTVFARGTGRSGVMFVGEGPGEEEDLQGLPFVGPAGQLLDRMIAAMKLDRDDVYVCNIVKCRPPRNRKPDLEEMQRCMPFLEEQIAALEPRVIVALGATAVQGLLGTTEGITRLRGQWKLLRGRTPVMPTFHPAFLLRQPGSKREVWQDLQEVMRRLEGPSESQ